MAGTNGSLLVIVAGARIEWSGRTNECSSSTSVVIKGLIVWTCALLDTIQDRTDATKGENKDSYDGGRWTSNVGRTGPKCCREGEIDAKRVHKIRLWSGRAVEKSLESMNREEGDLR